MIAFAGTDEFKFMRHAAIPALGLIGNVVMLIAILYLYIIGNADAQHEAYICFAIAGGWALVSVAYVVVNSLRSGRPLMATPPRQPA